MTTAIFWFRRDLRLDDHRGLCSALARFESVVPVFVLDPALLSRPDIAKARVRFLFEGLADLDAQLRARGGRLIVRSGDPAQVLPALARETGASVVFHADENEPHGRERDANVSRALQKIGVSVETHEDLFLVPPDAVKTQAGGVYTVFTPFFRTWSVQPIPPCLPNPPRFAVPPSLPSEPLPTADLTWPTACVRGGESEGERLLDRFLSGAAKSYIPGREQMAEAGTGGLSAYLKFGMLSPRRIRERVLSVRETSSPETWASLDGFVRQLAWRDFYGQILFHFPRCVTESFQPALNTVAWENDLALFDAWREGRTGYPVVDAAMRQLLAEGWMHNRARMIAASFLTKDLLVDWRWGERHFMNHLVDGDPANNNGGWQWAAGTGTDAQPYFRIFNPVSQGTKFDPDGDYVRRWVSELTKVPSEVIHEPWKLSPAERNVLGLNYPAPIVDHAVRRERALAMYKAAKEGYAP